MDDDVHCTLRQEEGCILREMLVALALLASAGVPAVAKAEVLTVPFTSPTPISTTDLYSGVVTVIVTGTGQSDGAALSDAFYVYTDQSGTPVTPEDQGYYDLGFGTGGSTSSIDNYVSPVLAYSPDHDYTFNINTGLSTPSQLDFSIMDNYFADKTGSFTISVAAAPEPSTWALMIAGIGVTGAALRFGRQSGSPATA